MAGLMPCLHQPAGLLLSFARELVNSAHSFRGKDERYLLIMNQLSFPIVKSAQFSYEFQEVTFHIKM
jgi:hypothetical protein